MSRGAPVIGSGLRRTCRVTNRSAPRHELLRRRVCRLFRVRRLLSGCAVLLDDKRLHGFGLTSALFSRPHILVVSGPFVNLSTSAHSRLGRLLGSLAARRRLRVVLMLDGDSSVPRFVARIMRIGSVGMCPGLAGRRCLTRHGPVPTRMLYRRLRRTVVSLPCDSQRCRDRRIIGVGGIHVRCNRHVVLGSLS